MAKKIILDLCGGTGSWSRPYKDAGYEVWNITLPDFDVLTWELKDIPIYGILAAPPCTEFSFARTKAKKPRDLFSGMQIVTACLGIIWNYQKNIKSDVQKFPPLKFWALENPYYGMLKWFLGRPAFTFDPYEFGDPYKKRTALWGHFNDPEKHPVAPETYQDHNHEKLPKFDYMRTKDIHPEYYGKYTRQVRRSITPKGFADAFFKANQ
jgi:hypothetical protein